MMNDSQEAPVVHNSSPSFGDENSNLTPIQSFYDNCNIFITGGTGFLGKSK